MGPADLPGIAQEFRFPIAVKIEESFGLGGTQRGLFGFSGAGPVSWGDDEVRAYSIGLCNQALLDTGEIVLSASTEVEEGVAWVTPEEMATLLPSRPISSSLELGWRGIVLQRYRHPPGSIECPPIRDHALVVNLAGETLLEERRDGGRLERRWTGRGHMSLTPAGQSVSRVLKGRPDIVLIHIVPALIDEVAEAVYEVDPGQVCLHSRLAVSDDNVSALGRLCLAEAAGGETGTSLAADMLARSLALCLLRSHSSLAARQPKPPEPGSSARAGRIIDYMRTHIAETLPLARLAGVAGLSQAQFARSFRDATGEPPHRFLTRLRVERACDLLRNTTLSVIEVGHECGFEQPNHFATSFRQSTGVSPRMWRSAHRP